MGNPSAGWQALTLVLDFKLCTPWNMRSPFAPTSFLHGTTAGTRPLSTDRVRCRRPHTIGEFSAEPISRAQVFTGTTGDRVPYMVGRTSVRTCTLTTPADHVCHPATYEVHWGSVQDPKREHHHPWSHRRHQTSARRRKLPGASSGNQPTGRDLAAPRGCLESCTKNQRAGRCPKHSKRAIIRPAVTGHNLMKPSSAITFVPSWNSSGNRTLVNTASEGGVVPQGSRSRHH